MVFIHLQFYQSGAQPAAIHCKLKALPWHESEKVAAEFGPNVSVELFVSIHIEHEIEV